MKHPWFWFLAVAGLAASADDAAGFGRRCGGGHTTCYVPVCYVYTPCYTVFDPCAMAVVVSDQAPPVPATPPVTKPEKPKLEKVPGPLTELKPLPAN